MINVQEMLIIQIIFYRMYLIDHLVLKMELFQQLTNNKVHLDSICQLFNHNNHLILFMVAHNREFHKKFVFYYNY
jgi:hypothetical protein